MRARNIKSGFFANDQLGECSFGARLAFIGLWLLADREGRVEDRPTKIKGELFRFDAVEIEPLLHELALRELIVRYSVNGARVIWCPTFLKHQTPHYKEPPSKLPPLPDDWDQSQYIASLMIDEADRKTHAAVNALPTAHPHGDDSAGFRERSSIKGGSTSPDILNPDMWNPESLNLASPKHHAEPAGSLHSVINRMPPLALVGNVEHRGGENTEMASEEDKPDEADKLPRCPHLEILALWAEVLPDMPRHLPGLWKGPRALNLRARWRETAAVKGWTTVEEGMTYFRKLFAYIGKSPFLTGRSPTRNTDRAPFIVELEWVIRPANWAKIIEGKYHQEVA